MRNDNILKKKEIYNLQQDISSLQNENAEQKVEIKALRAELGNLQNESNTHRMEISNLQLKQQKEIETLQKEFEVQNTKVILLLN